MSDTLAATKLGLTALAIGLQASPIPEPFKSAVSEIPGAVLQIIEIVEAVKGNVDDARGLALYIGQVTESTIRPLQGMPSDFSHQPPKEGLDEFRQTLDSTTEQIRVILSQNRASRILHYRSNAPKIAGMKQKIQDAIGCIQLETAFTTNHTVVQIGQKQTVSASPFLPPPVTDDHMVLGRGFVPYLDGRGSLLMDSILPFPPDIDRLIDRLGTGDNGASKKSPCLNGTRRTVLTKITKWIEGNGGYGFYLSGQAGTGKSSIAASIARREKAFKRLGAVFHFTRDDQIRNKAAILVIARQLASWQAGRLRPTIAAAIQEDLDIAQSTLDEQFQKLILEPLESLDRTCPTLVVILDAMDECDPSYASPLLRLVGKALSEGKLPSVVKLLITSRAEPWLQNHYDKEPMKSHLEVYPRR
ncbi:hypothetical protein FRB94_009476 [Tulasnella sp. JGI-2019a]|nr:hypothetical protein FRB94_009476 [Tulasnella sp. JGI-2019a]